MVPIDRKFHVLVADDDPDDLLLFNEALQQSALPVTFSFAEDGVKLIDYLENENVPDLIFLDVNMPLKNGIECLKEIRANSKFSTLPIVIYSTTSYQVNIDNCFSNGATRYVIKPNSFGDILKMVKKLCTKEWTSTISTPAPEYFVMHSFE